ncbi:MAG TPA: type II secretion system protein [Fibrobacteraceae bacterium]|jgi:prepilin-type N-terminal cleavage/methylation domain-containing protein|nr:type II secretion system protein [Fibrobacter sp.]HOG68422.1 type II secretion system protein [Fibrobacteraceae bacterium]HPW93582.1 type II secretion system protein [Fibrobacteraceae bacterium]
MNKGFSIIETLISLILISVLSTSLLFFLDGYREIQSLEQKRFQAFREASAWMEAEIDSPPFCLDYAKEMPLETWGSIKLSRTRITEKDPLVLIQINVFSKENKRLFSSLERVVECE